MDFQRQYWNIVKGLGIIAIVIGHTQSPLLKYVYMYHLALFFFVAGFLYKDDYSKDPFLYFSSRLKRLWWPMVKYGVIFVLFHNVLLKINIYSDKVNISDIIPVRPFKLIDFFYAIKGTIFMQYLEQIVSAMWFIYPLMGVLITFCVIRKISLFWANKWKCEIISGILVVLVGLLGLFLINKKIGLEYYTDIAFLVLPITYVGFIIKHYWDKFPFKWYLGLLSIIIIIGIYKFTGTHVELSIKQIISPKYFFLASFSGIYLNLYLAKKLQLSQRISSMLVCLGENSFHIMALHFLSFKVVNYIYILINSKPYYWVAKFPVIDKNWWIAYTIIGLFIPILLVQILRIFNQKILNILVQPQE